MCRLSEILQLRRPGNAADGGIRKKPSAGSPDYGAAFSHDGLGP
jgi:hypothetical protein